MVGQSYRHHSISNATGVFQLMHDMRYECIEGEGQCYRDRR